MSLGRVRFRPFDVLGAMTALACLVTLAGAGPDSRASSEGPRTPAAAGDPREELTITQEGIWPGFRRGASQSVAASGKVGMVGLYSGGLEWFDLSDPAAPRRLGGVATRRWPNAVALSDRLAVAAMPSVELGSGSGVEVFDVADPSAPRFLGRLETGGDAKDLVLDGDLAYLAMGSTGLAVISLANPSAPQLIGSYRGDGLVQAIAVSGSLAYLACAYAGVRIVTLANPAVPQQIGWIDTPGSAESIAVFGSWVVVADRWGGLRVIDVRDPRHPTEVSALTDLDAAQVVVAGHHAHVLDLWTRLRIIDLSNPAAPGRAGTLPLAANDLAVSGSHLLAASGESGVQIIETLDPAHPSLVGVAARAGAVQAVARRDSHLFVADGPAGLKVLDIADPFHPREVAHVDTPWASDVALWGTYALVADWVKGLVVVEVSKPEEPRWVGECRAPARALSVVASGRHAFVGAYTWVLWGGVVVVDLSDPTAPRVVSEVSSEHPGATGGIAMAGSRLLVPSALFSASGAGMAPGWLRIYDATDPARLQPLGQYRTTAESLLDVAVLDRLALVAADNAGLWLMETSDPARLGVLAQWNPQGLVAVAVAASGAHAYVADQGQFDPMANRTIGGLKVVRVSDPANPILSGQWSAPGSVNGVAVDGDQVFLMGVDGLQLLRVRPTGTGEPPVITTQPWDLTVSAGRTATLTVEAQGVREGGYLWEREDGGPILRADPRQSSLVFTPVQPDQAGGYRVRLTNEWGSVTSRVAVLTVRVSPDEIEVVPIGGCATAGFASGVALSGRYALVAEGAAGLGVYDLLEPAHPRRIGGFDSSGTALGVAVSGSFAYVADGPAGLRALDITNPADPIPPFGWTGAGTQSTGVAVAGNAAFVADGENGLHWIDVVDGLRVAGVFTLGRAVSVAASGSTVYFVETGAGMHVIDVSIPRAPRPKGTYRNPGTGDGMAVSGQHVLIADGASGLQVVSVSNPTGPLRVGTSPTGGYAHGVAAAEGHALVACGDAGIEVYDVSDPALPRRIGGHDSAGDARGVAWAGGMAVVADGSAGLQVFRIELPVSEPHIHRVNPVVVVSPLAGSGTGGYQDARGADAQFRSPNGGFTDAAGNVFVADTANHRLRRISPDGTVTTVAGTGLPGFADGPASLAQFRDPLGITADPAGNLLVADAGNHRVRRIGTDGNVTTLSGSGVPGTVDGPADTARFGMPNDLVVDDAGIVWVTDFTDHTVRRITPDGTASTWVGNGEPGDADGPRWSARLNHPGGIARGRGGVLYLTEWGGNRIRRIAPDGWVTTMAGDGVAGYRDGPAGTARFRNPDGIAVDLRGDLFVTDSGNHAIRRVRPAQAWVETVAGTGEAGSLDGPAATARFDTPSGIGTDGRSLLHVTDGNNHRVRRLEVPVAVPSSSNTLDAPPAAWWGMWEAGGTVIGDRSGQHQGTCFGGVALGLRGIASVPWDGAAGFDGVDDRIEVPYAADLNRTAFTVEFWAWLDAGVGPKTVVSSISEDPRGGYSVSVSADGRWNFRTATSGPAAWDDLTGPFAMVGRWTHLAAIGNGSAKQLFVDGALAAARPTDSVANPGVPLRLGAGGRGSTVVDPFAGRLDEVAVYERPLSAEDVFRHFSSGHRPEGVTGQRSTEGALRLAWTQGPLWEAPGIEGPWFLAANARSPWSVTTSHPQAFYRLDAGPGGFRPSPDRWVWIPPGRFLMGSPAFESGRDSSEGPQTEVTLSRGFWMGRFEVTQGEYLAVMGTNPSRGTVDPDLPVNFVKWWDATNYCVRLTERDRAAGRLPPGTDYRLPTEAQWEYACRAGTTTAFPWGDTLGSGQANFDGRYPYGGAPVGVSLGQATPGGSYPPNAWDLHDLCGNVREWCLDRAATPGTGASSLPGGQVTDPTGPSTPSWPYPTRVLRGGGWGSRSWGCRSAARSYGREDWPSEGTGFRVVLVSVP